MPKATKNPGAISFTATIEQGGHDGGAWVVFPYDLKETYGIGNLVPIIATFDGVEYRGSIAKMGVEPRIGVLKAIREQLGKGSGDTLAVTVTLDEQPRTLELPAELRSALDQNQLAKETFEKLAYSHRREYVRWIAEAKHEATKERRLAKAVELLMQGQRLKM